MIPKFYVRSIVALLLMPVVSRLAAGTVAAIDPESARGHDNYVRTAPLPGDADSQQLQRLPQLLRIICEVLRFAVFGFVAMHHRMVR